MQSLINVCGLCCHIAASRKSFPVASLSLSPLRQPAWRFNFVEVLADYRYLAAAAVMENAAQAGGEQGDGTLIRTAALGRFPWREQWDRPGEDTLDVRWKTPGPPALRRAGWLAFKPPYYLIGSLQAGRPSTFVGRIKELKGCILIGFTGPGTKRSASRLIKKEKKSSPQLGLLQGK